MSIRAPVWLTTKLSRRGEKSVLEELKAGHDRAISTPEAMDIVRRLKPRFPPGTPGKAHYSDANYRLLGAIIESVTGKSIQGNYCEHIFEPLGLERTYSFDRKDPKADEPPATLYLKDKRAVVPRYLSSNVSDGGLVSTARECLQFLRAFFEGRLFDEFFYTRMMDWKRLFFPLRYGYGLMYFKLPRFFWPRPLPEFIGHAGSTGSFAFTCPSRELYFAGTLNQISSPARPFFLMINMARRLAAPAAG